MPVPTSIADLSTSAGSNYPQDADPIGTSLDDYLRSTQAIIKQNAAKGSDITSGTSITIPASGSYFIVTGSTTIASISDTNQWDGRTVFLEFSGTPQLTHSAGLILPGAANYTCVAGDVFIITRKSSGVYKASSLQSIPTDGSITGAKLAANTVTLDKISMASGAFSFRNKILNGNFPVNQRGVSGTVVLTAGQYGHDRWKAGASGCTYTFASSANVVTLTISAGSLQQVIEGVNLQSGTHVLTWTGTAQGKIDGGSYSASGVTGTATGGTNMTVEFNTGTLSLVQLEQGTARTAFEHRLPALEQDMCKRYYQRRNYAASEYIAVLQCYSASSAYGTAVFLDVPMRIKPTVITSSALGTFSLANATSTMAAVTTNLSFAATNNHSIAVTQADRTGNGLVAGNASFFYANATAFIAADAEL